MDLGKRDRGLGSLRIGAPNFLKDVPNFLKNIPNLVKDVLRVPKFISRWERTFNDTSLGSLKDQMDHEKGYRGPDSPMIRYTKFS